MQIFLPGGLNLTLEIKTCWPVKTSHPLQKHCRLSEKLNHFPWPMAQPSITTLLAALKDDDATNRALATDTLWQIWFNQKGEAGYQLLQRSQDLLNEGQLTEAEALLSRTIEDFPDFSEAWNRRASAVFPTKPLRRGHSRLQAGTRPGALPLWCPSWARAMLCLPGTIRRSHYHLPPCP